MPQNYRIHFFCTLWTLLLLGSFRCRIRIFHLIMLHRYAIFCVIIAIPRLINALAIAKAFPYYWIQGLYGPFRRDNRLTVISNVPEMHHMSVEITMRTKVAMVKLSFWIADLSLEYLIVCIAK
jgi:hypothetical protein